MEPVPFLTFFRTIGDRITAAAFFQYWCLLHMAILYPRSCSIAHSAVTTSIADVRGLPVRKRGRKVGSGSVVSNFSYEICAVAERAGGGLLKTPTIHLVWGREHAGSRITDPCMLAGLCRFFGVWYWECAGFIKVSRPALSNSMKFEYKYTILLLVRGNGFILLCRYLRQLCSLRATS
jgi:hypothetical protein